MNNEQGISNNEVVISTPNGRQREVHYSMFDIQYYNTSP